MIIIIIFSAFMLLWLILSIFIVKRFRQTDRTPLDSITFIRYWTFLSLLLFLIMTGIILLIMRIYFNLALR